jgi:peptidylprolyl isomerase
VIRCPIFNKKEERNMAKTKKNKTSVKSGQSVKVHYKGTLDDGTVFDSSRDRGSTLDFKVGDKAILPDFENAVVGMAIGETKAFKIVEGYGPHHAEAFMKVPTESFPDNFDFVIGGSIQGTNEKGDTIQATISSIEDDGVTLDHNHPLAGQDLNFEVELVEIL